MNAQNKRRPVTRMAASSNDVLTCVPMVRARQEVAHHLTTDGTFALPVKPEQFRSGRATAAD